MFDNPWGKIECLGLKHQINDWLCQVFNQWEDLVQRNAAPIKVAEVCCWKLVGLMESYRDYHEFCEQRDVEPAENAVEQTIEYLLKELANKKAVSLPTRQYWQGKADRLDRAMHVGIMPVIMSIMVPANETASRWESSGMACATKLLADAHQLGYNGEVSGAERMASAKKLIDFRYSVEAAGEELARLEAVIHRFDGKTGFEPFFVQSLQTCAALLRREMSAGALDNTIRESINLRRQAPAILNGWGKWCDQQRKAVSQPAYHSAGTLRDQLVRIQVRA